VRGTGREAALTGAVSGVASPASGGVKAVASAGDSTPWSVGCA